MSMINTHLNFARVCAAKLYAQGARRVWLFGALASSHEPDVRSDLDLVVDGIPFYKLPSISKELKQMMGFKVDLVDMTTAPYQLRPHICRTRVLLPRDE